MFSFNSLKTAFVNSLNIYLIATLKSMPAKFNIWAHSETTFIECSALYPPPSMGYTFLLLFLLHVL